MDGIEELLQAWGDWLVCRTEGPRASKAHSLDRARAFAPVTRERFLRSVVGRDGLSRRAFMADQMQAGDRHPALRVIPMWAVDPVPCTGSRGGPARNDSGSLPDHLRPIDAAVRALAPLDPLAALCLRVEYTGTGAQADRADQAAKRHGQALTLRQYRGHLYRGRDVLRRKLGHTVDKAVTLR